MSTKRNGNIDVLKFLFSIIIVIFHFNAYFKLGLMKMGWIGVEFFFVVSGYLMCEHAKKINHDIEFSHEIWNFISNKIKVFYKYFILAVLLTIIAKYFDSTNILETTQSLLQLIPTLSITSMGFVKEASSFVPGNAWYLSAMILAMFVSYPLLVKEYEFSRKIIFPIISVFLLGYLVSTNGNLSIWNTWSTYFRFGFLRALAEISLGISIHPLCELIKNKSGNKKNIISTLFYSIIEIACLYIVFLFANGAYKKGFSIHALFYCTILITLCFCNLGIKIPDCKFSRLLGKWSLGIYIFHGVMRLSLGNVLGKAGLPKIQIYLIILLTIIFCIILMYITDYTCKLFSNFHKRNT